MKVSLETGDEATARVRWNRVHEQVEGLVQMGQVLDAEEKRRRRQCQSVGRLPAGVVGTIAAQARHDLLAEHDQTWVDPSFTSPLTGVVVRLMRDAGRAASPDAAVRHASEAALRRRRYARSGRRRSDALCRRR